MARGAASSAHRDDQHPPQGEVKTSKRRCVQSACVPCRKRKSKCDGGTPVCATCTAVYKTECFYDPESDARRQKAGSSAAFTTGIKRDAASIVTSSGDSTSGADFLITSLQKLPEDHIQDLISHIRKDPKADIAALAESWRSSVALPSSSPLDVHSLESDLSLLLGKPAVTLTGESRHYGHSASLGLVAEEESFSGGQARTGSVQIERQGTTWTTVTNDLAFVEKLLSLYFTWSHPFYVLFSRECFYKDFRAGRDKYCSSLLVNAICAYACHLTDDPAGRTEPSNFRTSGDHFFKEARRLLFEDESPCLTTVQALCILSMREPSTGRESSGFGYNGRCIRMCIEMGLHLKDNASPALGLTPSEVEVRKVTFWGCFTVDAVYSIAVGRISQLPRAAITLDKPILEEAPGVPEGFPAPTRAQPGVVTTRMFLQEFTSLSELINDNNYMFYGPRDRLTSAKLLDCYNKYQAWYARLPLALTLNGRKQVEPHILVLHMLYHTIIVHLFRPFLKVDLMHSDVRPRDICIDQANRVASLLRTYRQFYDLRVAHLIIPHILLTTCIVHLLFSKESRTSYENLVEGLHGLEEVHECHYFGARSFRIIYTLAKTWDMRWPEELENSILLPRTPSEKSQRHVSPQTDPAMAAPSTATRGHVPSNMPYPAIGRAERRESLSMFAASGSMQLPSHSNITRPGSVPAAQRVESPIVGHSPTNYNPNMSMPGYSYIQPMTSVQSNVPVTVTSPTSDAAENLFWNPIPGLPGPILARESYQMGPMGLDTVLQSSDMGDRLGRDGFKINEDWQSRHVNGFPSRTSSGFANQNGQPAGAYMSSSNSGYSHSNDAAQYQQTQHPSHAHHHHHHQQQPPPPHQHQGQHSGYEPGWYSNQMS